MVTHVVVIKKRTEKRKKKHFKELEGEKTVSTLQTKSAMTVCSKCRCVF